MDRSQNVALVVWQDSIQRDFLVQNLGGCQQRIHNEFVGEYIHATDNGVVLDRQSGGLLTWWITRLVVES